jgi:MFS family permease
MSERPRGRYRDVLRQRDFVLLAVGSLIDQIGSWSYSVVLAVEVYHRTHSTIWLAGLSGSRWGVGLLLSGYAGVIADRYERTRLMLSSALASGLVMIAMAFAVGFTWPVWWLLVLSVSAGVVASPYRSAAGALTPEIVDEKNLAAANGLFSTIESLVVVIGPAIGGLLLLVGAPVVGVIVNAASFFVSAGIILQLRVRSTGSAERGGGVLAQWLVGVRALGAHQVALVLVLFCALDSMVYGASTVIYAPLSVRLGTGINGYSYLLAGSALGGVIAAGLANWLSARSRLAPVIIGSLFLQALPFVATAYVHSAAPAFVLQVVSGIGMIIVDVLAITALQRDLEGGVLSRVLGVFDAIVIGAIMAASFITAAVLSNFGVVAALRMVGIAVPAIALLGLPLLIRGDRKSAAEVAELAPFVDVLGRLDLFTGARRPVLERLAAAAEERQLPAGEVLIRQGDAADALWVLVSGSLAVQARDENGADQQLPDVAAPGYVGELGLVRRSVRTATVSTRQECTVLRIEGSVFLEAIESAPPSASFVQLTGARWERTAPRGVEGT